MLTFPKSVPARHAMRAREESESEIIYFLEIYFATLVMYSVSRN